MKQNDYIIASLNNPEFNPGDFRTLGMDLDNTQMLSKDEYLKSDYIKQNDAFKDENGEFSLGKFDTFYDNSLKNFQTFSNIETDFQYDMFDYRRFDKENANVKDPKLKFFQITNPQELTIGDGWVNEINESPLSDRERAAKSKIYDYEKGEFLDYSPNEHTLVNNPIEWFKDLFDEPLVLAQYEEDGTHIDPFSGREIKHAKGEYKIGSDGKYFYETLGGRDLGSKLILSKFDTLTVDGEGLNKYDFFDSDDREKSVGGIIMKTAAAIAPMFLPGPWATAYSIALVGRELVKVLPMIDGLAGMVTGNDTPTAFTRLANNWAGRATSWTSSQDDYSRDNMVSLGSFANLMSDVALLWGQQKVIAKAVSKLKGASSLTKGAEESAFKLWQNEANNLRTSLGGQGLAETEIAKIVGDATTWKTSALGASLLTNAMKKVYPAVEKAQELGKSASLMYMALVSNTDVYQSMLEHGLTKREAMAVTLGSTFGMFAVDKYLHLGDTFFDDWGTDTGGIAIRNAIAKEVDKWSSQLKTIAKEAGKNGKDKTWTTIFKTQELLKPKYETFFSALKNHSLSALGKSLGEGLEEVSEEVCSDMSKQIYEWTAQWDTSDKFFGDLTTDNVNAFDNLGEDPNALNKIFARYGMNFLGGFMGGGLFWGVEKWQNRNIPKRTTDQDNLVYAIRNYGAKRLLGDLKEKHNNKKLGNANLSIDYETVDGLKTWLTASENHMSLNDFVYNQIKNTIIGIDKIINDNELMKTDDELRDLMTMGELRFSRLLEILDENTDYSKGYINRYNTLVTDFAVIESKIQELQATKPDPAKAASAYEQDIAKLEKKKADILEQIEQFKSGENALDYMDMMLFGMDEKLNQGFYPANFGAWLRALSNDEDNPHDIRSFDDFDKLDASEKKALVDKYMKYKNSGAQRSDMEKGWKAFKDLRETIGDSLVDMQVETKDSSPYLKMMHDILYSEDSPLFKTKKFTAEEIADDDPDYDWDAKTDKEEADLILYNSRNTKLATESDEDFDKRQEERKNALKTRVAMSKTRQSMLDALDKVKDMIQNGGGFLAPQDRRHLLNMLEVRLKDVVSLYSQASSLPIMSANEKHIRQMLDEIKDDLSNFDDVRQKVSDALQEEFKIKFENEISEIYHLRLKIINYNNKNVANFLRLAWINGVLSRSERNGYDNKTYQYLKSLGLEDIEHRLLDSAGNEFKYTDLKDIALDNLQQIFVNVGGSLQSLHLVLLQGINNNKIDFDAIANYSVRTHLYLNQMGVFDLEQNNEIGFDSIRYEVGLRDKFWALCHGKGILNDDETAIDKDKLNALIVAEALKSKPKGLKKAVFLKKMHLDPDGIKTDSDEKDAILYALFGDYHIVDILNATPDTYEKAKEKLLRINLYLLPNLSGEVDPVEKHKLLKALSDMLGIKVPQLENIVEFKLNSSTGFFEVDFDETLENLSEYNGIRLSNFGLDSKGAIVMADDMASPNGVGAITLAMSSQYFHDLVQRYIDLAKTKFDLLKGQIENDSVFDYIKTLKEAKPINNPVIEIVKKLGLGLNRDTKNVEALLERMSTVLHSGRRDDFVLTNQDRAALEEADDLLLLAQSFLWSCYNSKTYQYPYPHNLLHNLIVDKYNLNLEKLPEIDDDVAQLYWKTIEGLRREIGKRTDSNEMSWTQGSYRYWDARNAVNKAQKLIKATELSTKAKIELLKQHKNDFVGSIEEGGVPIPINLLEGIDSISDVDDDVALYKIEKLFYSNFQKLLTEHPDWTLEKIFNGTGISIITSNKDILRELTVVNADENLRMEKFTPMDKAMYFITLAGLDPDLFYAAQLAFMDANNNIAPLDVLATPTRQGMMYMQSPELYQSGIDWLYDKAGCETTGHAKIYGLFIPGNGGVGKTQVCVKGIATYGKDANIILASPTDGLLANLKSIGIGTTALVDNLIIDMIGETNFALCQNDAGSMTGSMKPLSPAKGLPDIPSYVGAFDLKNLNTGMIVVDEATHLPLWKIQILSEYGLKYKIPIIFVGDNYQLGFMSPSGAQANLNSEYVFMGRSSRLAITLRDANFQKYYNIKKMTHLISALSEEPLANPTDPSSVTRREIKLKQAIENFKNLKISYYNGTELNGDIIVNNLTEDLLDKVDIPEKIAYIGTDTTTFEMLKRKYGDKVVLVTSEVAVQGQEFDSVVVDVNWGKINLTDDYENNASFIVNFLRRFYTLSTRGKESAIFIDRTGNLKSLINQEEENYQNKVTNFGDEAKKNFKKFFDERIKKYNIPDGISPVYTPTTPSTASSGNATSSTTTTGGSSSSTTTTGGSSSSTTTTGGSAPSSPSPTTPSGGRGARAEVADPGFISPTPSAKPTIPDPKSSEPVEAEGIVKRGDDLRNNIEEKYPSKKDKKGNPIPSAGNLARAYGAASIAGVNRIDVKNDSGDVVSHIYELENSDTLSDLGVFMDGKTNSLSTTEDIQYYVKKLLDFKNLFLFEHDYKVYQRLFRNLENEGQDFDIIDEDTYNAILNGDPRYIKIVVSKRNPKTDNFVGLSGLDSDKMEIGSEKLVYKIVAQFPMKNGKQARITLGLMANPTTYEDNRTQIIERLVKYLNSKDADAADKLWAAAYLRELNKSAESDPVRKYNEYVEQLAANWKRQGTEEYVADVPSQLHYSRTSVLRNVYLGNKETRRVRFNSYDGYNKPTFTSMYGNSLVISDVFIYLPDNSISKEHRPSYTGKPVVFISADTTLNSNELLKAWETELASHQHSVRAVRLDNMGVTLELLCDRNMKGLFRTKRETGGFDKLPFENREMGIRMLISLWNWRANINNFEKQWGDYKVNSDVLSSLTNEVIDDVLAKMHNIYKSLDASLNSGVTNKSEIKHPTTQQYNDALQANLSEAEFKIANEINIFNKSIENTAREFRLGAGNDNRGYIIRSLDIQDDNVFYKRKGKGSAKKPRNIYGIYVTLGTLSKMSEMTDSLCSLIFGPEELPFYYLEDNNGNRLDKSSHIDVDRFNGYLQTILNTSGKSGATGLSSKSFHWTEGTTEAEKDMTLKLIKAIPLNIVKITLRSIAYGKTIEKDGQPMLPPYQRVSRRTGKTVTFASRPWEMNNVDHIQVTYHELNDQKEKIGEEKVIVDMDIRLLIMYGKARYDGDLTLAKMLDLCFHGTTDEFIETDMSTDNNGKPYYENVQDNPSFTPQAEDAYFKYGFLSDPMAQIVRDPENKNSSLWAKSATLGAMYTLNTRVDMPYVYFDFTGSETTTKEGAESSKNVLDNTRMEIFNYDSTDIISNLESGIAFRTNELLREAIEKELLHGHEAQDDWDSIKYSIGIDYNSDNKQRIIIAKFVDPDTDDLFRLEIKENGEINIRKLNPTQDQIVDIVTQELLSNQDQGVSEGAQQLLEEAKANLGISEINTDKLSMEQLRDVIVEMHSLAESIEDEDSWVVGEIGLTKEYDAFEKDSIEIAYDIIEQLRDIVTGKNYC